MGPFRSISTEDALEILSKEQGSTATLATEVGVAIPIAQFDPDSAMAFLHDATHQLYNSLQTKENIEASIGYMRRVLELVR